MKIGLVRNHKLSSYKIKKKKAKTVRKTTLEPFKSLYHNPTKNLK